MIVEPGKSRTLYLHKNPPRGAALSCVLTTRSGEVHVLNSAHDAGNVGAFYIPGELLVDENLPAEAALRVNNLTLKRVILESPAREQQVPSGTSPLTYSDGQWPTRPSTSEEVVFIWAGGSPSNPPPGIPGVDIWMVPEA